MGLTVDSCVWVAAADVTDAFCVASRQFLAKVAQTPLAIYLPALAWVEIACALARKRHDPAAGRTLSDAILNCPSVVRVPLDGPVLDAAVKAGTTALLRGGDAIFAATAHMRSAQLVSWDQELIHRAGAVSPTDWLAAHP